MTNWIKVMNSLPSHPKILRAGERAAWLYVCGLCYANEHLTDGYIDKAVLVVAAPGVKAPERLAAELVDAGLWDVVDGGWQVHDYGDHQRTAAQVKNIRRKDRERKGTKDSDDTLDPDSARNPDGFQTDSARELNGNPSRTRTGVPSQEEKREELTPPTPSPEFAEWIAHHEQTTGHTPPGRGTKAFHAIAAAYQARRAEGYPAEDLKLATVGAHADDHRRANGYDTPDSVLRPTKIASLIAKGKLRSGSRGTVTSVELGERLRGGAA